MIEAAWYFRLFYVHMVSVGVSFLLYGFIRAKRMGAPDPGRPWAAIFWLGFIVGWVLMWFVSFRINATFWLGIGILVFGEVVYALGFMAMRERPEKKKKVVDWGIYRVSRHSHILAGIICLLGVIVMGWNRGSVTYIVLWIYFVASVTVNHLYVLAEEKINREKFGKEYEDYMKRVPRYFLIGRCS